ncbi:protein TAB2 homolog, chloroplastic-like [Phoenix dactylifera]|uniref:Protein TAB2 homolog, chloroplastic-like n=1 Tax=Phoenix dactylifera TaxID=42345 RepID=A0A8B9AJT0_PHODC|nr:protein TAB2 homolog, chloroplastic-like [Phoenix dactylifera]
MATLGFNSPGIRNPVAPIISRALVSLSKTLSIPPSTFPSSKARAYRHRHRRRPLNPRPNSISESSVSPPASSKEEEEESGLEEEEEVDPRVEVRYLDPGMEAGSIGEWQLDFCSRPILDERGKKVWELVVCDGTLSLQYTRFFPNNVINSVTLRDAIASISASLGVPLPQKIRFFRSQMQTIITKACNELGIKAVPSKRVRNLPPSFQLACVYLLLVFSNNYHL